MDAQGLTGNHPSLHHSHGQRWVSRRELSSPKTWECRTKPVGLLCHMVLGNPFHRATCPARWLASAACRRSRLPPRVPGDWAGREAGEEEASGKQPRQSGAGPPPTARPGRAHTPPSERGKARGLVANSVLAAPQGLPGRLEFLRSINYVLQIKIATQRTEDIKNSSTYSPLLRVLWERVRQLHS